MVTRTYIHNDVSVRIDVDVRCNYLSDGEGRFIPVSCIKYTVGAEDEKEIPNVQDEDVEKRLQGLEAMINAYIDGTPALVKQLNALGYA